MLRHAFRKVSKNGSDGSDCVKSLRSLKRGLGFEAAGLEPQSETII